MQEMAVVAISQSSIASTGFDQHVLELSEATRPEQRPTARRTGCSM